MGIVPQRLSTSSPPWRSGCGLMHGCPAGIRRYVAFSAARAAPAPNVDPLAVDLATAEERARLARALGQGLERIVGYVLPLERRRFSPARWVSGAWEFRQGRCCCLEILRWAPFAAGYTPLDRAGVLSAHVCP